MRRLVKLLTSCFIATAFATSAVYAGIETVTLSVSGMT